MTAYILAGLPGAGKTTVAEIGADITDGSIISAGDMIRRMAAEDGLEDPTSEELGEYAAQCREDIGPGFFGERAVGMMARGDIDPEFPVWIDSCRHAGGVTEFREYFDQAFLVWVSADTVDQRLDRLQDRGRDDEAEFTMAELLQRDSRELSELGVGTILDDSRIDYQIVNDKSIKQLRTQVGEIV